MAIRFNNPLKIGGYIRVEHEFKHFHPLMDWVVVEEKLARTSGRLILPNKDHTKTGTVLKIGDRAIATTGIKPGDTIIYTEWEGGRWEFPDLSRDGGMIRVLIMECAFIQAIIRDCEHETGCGCEGTELPESATLAAA